jgi:hypothetical protein
VRWFAARKRGRERWGGGEEVEWGEEGGGECELSLSPSSYVDHSFVQCERNAYGNSQHTRGFEAFVCTLCRAVEFIVEFGALGEISVALA